MVQFRMRPICVPAVFGLVTNAKRVPSGETSQRGSNAVLVKEPVKRNCGGLITGSLVSLMVYTMTESPVR